MGQVDVACPLGGFVLCLMWTSNVTAWLIYGVSEVILEANWSHWPVTTRKLINTNGNIEGIFPSVNFRGILPTEIFPRYIPRELPWEKKLKQSKKKWWRVIFTNGITDETNSVGDSVGKFAGKLWTLFIMSSTKGITDRKFRRYCPDSKSLTDWKVVGVIWRFSEKIQLI